MGVTLRGYLLLGACRGVSNSEYGLKRWCPRLSATIVSNSLRKNFGGEEGLGQAVFERICSVWGKFFRGGFNERFKQGTSEKSALLERGGHGFLIGWKPRGKTTGGFLGGNEKVL